MGVTRREFVKGAGAGGLLAATGMPRLGSEEVPSTHLGRGTRSTDDVWIDGLGGLRLGPEGFDEIERSGLTMIETTLGAPGAPPFGYEQAVRDIAEWQGRFAANRDRIVHVRSWEDIVEARDSGKLAVMIGFQNATHLQRDIQNVDFFYDLGIRQMQLTYNSLNALGAGCTERDDVGLSDFGVQVVERMNERGMIVDVSHTGYKTTMDAVEVSAVPIVFSHSNCMALCDNPRGKTDDEIKKLASRGGVMGITTVNFFVSKKVRSTLDDYIDHIAHVADLVGVDHVGIGTDSSIGGWRTSFPTEEVFWDFHAQFHFKPEVDLRWPPFIEEIDNPQKMHIIADALGSRGFSSEDVRKVMGANFFNVYKQILE